MPTIKMTGAGTPGGSSNNPRNAPPGVTTPAMNRHYQQQQTLAAAEAAKIAAEKQALRRKEIEERQAAKNKERRDRQEVTAAQKVARDARTAAEKTARTAQRAAEKNARDVQAAWKQTVLRGVREQRSSTAILVKRADAQVRRETKIAMQVHRAQKAGESSAWTDFLAREEEGKKSESSASAKLHFQRKANEASNFQSFLDREEERKQRLPMAMKGGATGISAVAAVVAAVLEAPLISGQLMRGIMDSARPYLNTANQSYSFARRMGLPGSDISGAMYPGVKGQGIGWMARLGLTPDTMMHGLESYGIVPGSQSDMTRGLGEAFGNANLSRGLSGLGDDIAQRIARQGVGAGAASNTAAGVTAYLTPFEKLLTQAGAAGMDRSKVLGNIESSLDMIEKSGAMAMQPQSVLDMFTQMMKAGPGGRTGATAARFMEGADSRGQNILESSLSTFAMLNEMSRLGIGTGKAGDFEKLIGPDVAKTIREQNPAGFEETKAQFYSALKGGRRGVAGRIATSAAQPVNKNFLPGIAKRFSESVYPNSPDLRALLGAGITNSSLQDFTSYLSGETPQAPGGRRRLTFLERLGGAGEGGANQYLGESQGPRLAPGTAEASLDVWLKTMDGAKTSFETFANGVSRFTDGVSALSDAAFNAANKITSAFTDMPATLGTVGGARIGGLGAGQ